MTERECIDALDKLTRIDSPRGWDKERDHSEADQILLGWLDANGHKAIADAWRRADERCGGFWYA